MSLLLRHGIVNTSEPPIDPNYIDPTYQSPSYTTFIETAYVLSGVARSGQRIRKTSGVSSIHDFVVGKHALTGKRYWEVVIGTGNQTDCYPGMTDGVNRVNFASTGSNALWNDGYGWTAAGRYLVNGSNQFSKPTWDGLLDGYTLMFAYDADTKQVYHGRNGSWSNDPTGGGASSIDCSFFGDAYVAINLDDINDEFILATQEADLLYPIPTGYSPLLPV